MNIAIHSDISAAKQIEDPIQRAGRILALWKTFIIIGDYGVINLIGGASLAETDDVVRARALKNLTAIIETSVDTYVLIENQSNINGQTGNIQAQLLFAYSDSNVYLVNPRHKNKVCLGPQTNYALFESAYTQKYEANKAHSVACAYTLDALLGWNLVFPKKMDDLADAIMQAVAFGAKMIVD